MQHQDSIIPDDHQPAQDDHQSGQDNLQLVQDDLQPIPDDHQLVQGDHQIDQEHIQQLAVTTPRSRGILTPRHANVLSPNTTPKLREILTTQNDNTTPRHCSTPKERENNDPLTPVTPDERLFGEVFKYFSNFQALKCTNYYYYYITNFSKIM